MLSQCSEHPRNMRRAWRCLLTGVAAFCSPSPPLIKDLTHSTTSFSLSPNHQPTTMNTILVGTSNFQQWHAELKLYLKERGLWEKVAGPFPGRKNWKAFKNNQAQRILISAVVPELLPSEYLLKKAWRIYQYLCECYGEDEPVQQSINAGYLARLRFDSDNESLQAFTDKYVAAIIPCERSGCYIDTAHQGDTLLGLIEPECPNTVAAKREEMRDGDMPTLKEIIPELAYECKEEEYYASATIKNTLYSNIAAHRARCHCCYFYSHSAMNCFHLHPKKCPTPGFEPQQRLVKRYYRRFGELVQEGWERALLVCIEEEHDIAQEGGLDAMQEGWHEDLADRVKGA